MQIRETGSEGLKKIYHVTALAADLEKQSEAELKQLSKKVKLPGFRPGHIPMKVLKQRYGQGVQEDVIRSVINNAAAQAVKENNLRPASQPDVKLEEYKEGGDLTFTLTVESLPEVPEVDFSGITLERETFEVEQSELDEALERLAKRSPKPKVLDAKAKAKEGNVVVVDFKGMVDGVAFEGGTAEKFSIEIGSGRLIDGFETQLIGLKAGDEKNVNVTFPENYFNKELAGKPAVFEVKVHEVSELETPAVDEAFAKDRGFESLEKLQEAVRGGLRGEMDQMVRTRLKKRLFDTLENKVDFPLPQSMVEAEFNAIWQRLQQARQEEPSEDIYEGRPEEEVKKEYQQIADRRVKLGILLAELGSRQKLQVTREELTKGIMDQARMFPGQEQAVFDFYRKNPARLDELRGPILEEKAVDWVLTQVKLTDKPVTAAELRESDGEEEGAPKAKKPAAKKKASSAKKKTGDDEASETNS